MFDFVEAKYRFNLKRLTKISEMMNPRGYTPSSFFSEEVCLSDEVFIACIMLTMPSKRNPD